VPGSADKYVALFNAQSKGDSVDFSMAQYVSPVIAGIGKSQEVEISLKGGKRLALFVRGGGDGSGWDHAVWVDPVLTGPDGELKLTDLGLSGKVRVRDLWAREDLGEFTGSFSQELPLHGAGLYRLSPID